MEEEPLDLQLEFKKLKALITPMIAFTQELKDLKRDLHISSESSISSINIITSHIRSEIVKDLNGLLSKSDEKLALFVQESQQRQKEVGDKIINLGRQDDHLENMIRDTHDLIGKQGTLIDKLRKDLDFASKELNEKVGYTEFIKLNKSLKHYAPLVEVNNIKTRIEELAEKSQVEEVNQSLKATKKSVEQCLTRSEALTSFDKIQKDIMQEFTKTFVTLNQFNEVQQENSKKSIKGEEESKGLTKKVEMIYEGFKRKISELFDILGSKPWDVEFKHVWDKIEELATNEKLSKFREEVADSNLNTKKNIIELENRAKNTETIISRIDEIMLDKASKDDICYLTKQLEKYSLTTTLNEISSEVQSKLTSISSLLSYQNTFLETLKSNFHSITQKLETLKKENYDVSNISLNLNNINETLDRKADKSDIFLIHDLMGKKEEILKLNEIEGICRRQVLLAVGVLQSFCRTFLTAGENPSVIKQQRLDVYKSLDGLQRWIKEGNGEPSSFLSIGRSNVNLKTDIFEELPHTGTARFNSRRNRLGSVGTSPRYNKDELPLLNF